MTTPQIHFDDPPPPLSDGWIWFALVLLLAAVIVFGLLGCSSFQTSSPVIVYTFLGWPYTTEPVASFQGPPLPPGWGGGSSGGWWNWKWTVGTAVLLFVFPRTRNILIPLISWLWKVPQGRQTWGGAGADVLLAAPRLVGLVHSKPPEKSEALP